MHSKAPKKVAAAREKYIWFALWPLIFSKLRIFSKEKFYLLLGKCISILNRLNLAQGNEVRFRFGME